MNGGKQTERGQELMRAVGMAGKEWTAGTQPAEQGNCRRTQPADSPPGTGLSTNTRPTVGRPCSKNNSCRSRWPASCRTVQVSGGSANVLAARKAGSDLPTLSLPHLSPLPVTVPTHSLNLAKTQFSPKLTFFFVIFYFILPFTSPLKIRPLTPFIVFVRLT